MIRIRKFQRKDLRKIVNIKNKVFKRFNSEDYFDKDGIKRYLDYTNPKKSDEELMKSLRVDNKDIFYVAVEDKKIIGYIKGSKNKMGNLFVLGESHRKGIGKKLVCAFEKEAIKQGSKEIKIKSSVYAVPFYEKIGYKKTTGIRNIVGLKIQPMKKELI